MGVADDKRVRCDLRSTASHETEEREHVERRLAELSLDETTSILLEMSLRVLTALRHPYPACACRKPPPRQPDLFERGQRLIAVSAVWTSYSLRRCRVGPSIMRLNIDAQPSRMLRQASGTGIYSISSIRAL